jgi:hypothetical protein
VPCIGATPTTASCICRAYAWRLARHRDGLSTFGLAEARTKAAECRRLTYDGVDPIEARRTERAKTTLDAAKSLTFKECTEQYIAAHRAGWRNPKHAAQWSTTVKTYAEPIIGTLPVQGIDTGLVMKIIEPKKPETAARLRGPIEAVLDWAAARGHRQSENPARSRGHLDKLLPARAKVRKVKHHAAFPESGERITGTYRQSVQLVSGKYALVERSREFTLVPWRPVIEKELGKQVSGLVRGNGISWELGRQRGLGIGM